MKRPRFEIKSTTDDRSGVVWYWRLVGGNNEIVCSSHPETFKWASEAKDAALNARRLARLARVK